MPQITGARNYVEVPPVEVARGGILAAARVVDVTDPHSLLGAEYLTDACAQATILDDFCTAPDCESEKVFEDGPELVEGDPFAVQAGLSCNLSQLDESLARVRRMYDYAERAALDRQMCAWLDANATDIAAPAPGGVAAAVGAAELFAAQNYGGVPTIVVSVQDVARLCEASVLHTNLDGSLATCQGSRVANAACTPGAIYVTGQITLLRGEILAFAAPSQPMCDGTTQPARALAERIYVPLVECLVGKVTVTP